MPWLLQSEISHTIGIIWSLVRQMPRHMSGLARQLAWCAQMPRAASTWCAQMFYPFENWLDHFKVLIRTKMVSTTAPLYSFLRNRSEAKTKTPILSENHLILKHGSHSFILHLLLLLLLLFFFLKFFTFFNFLDFYFKTKSFLYAPHEGVSILPHEDV